MEEYPHEIELDLSPTPPNYPVVPPETERMDWRRNTVDEVPPRTADSLRASFHKAISTISREVQRIREQYNRVDRRLHTPQATDPFTWVSLVVCLASVALWILDYSSDIAVAIALRGEEAAAGQPLEERRWFTLTVSLICVPLLVVNVFSLVWIHQDRCSVSSSSSSSSRRDDHHRGVAAAGGDNCQMVEDDDGHGEDMPSSRSSHIPSRTSSGFYPRSHKFSNRERFFIVVCHLFGFGPLLRQLYIIYCGLREKRLSSQLDDKLFERVQGPYCPRPQVACNATGTVARLVAHYYSVRKYYERDSAYLGLIDGFIQDAPQLLLQFYILSSRSDSESNIEKRTVLLQLSSVAFSTVSLSRSLVSYEQANRWATPDRSKISLCGIIFQFCWRFCTIASRVVILAMFAAKFHSYACLFLGVHWGLMVCWILLMNTNFCGSAENVKRPVSEFVYNLVMGIVYVFDILALKDGPTRLKYLFYYTLVALETLTMVLVLNLCPPSGGSIPFDQANSKGWAVHASYSTLVTFSAGICFMSLYYRNFHPRGQLPDNGKKASLF